MRTFVTLMLMVFLFQTFSVSAAQYRSRELSAPKNPSEYNEKSIEELEQELATIEDAYSKASTAQFLARFYLSQGEDADLDKAITYYIAALTPVDNEQGLSIYAQQAGYLELANIYFYKKNYRGFSEALENYINVKGKPDVALLIKQSYSYYHLQYAKKALAKARQAFTAIKQQKNFSDIAALQQLLFVFFQLQAYSQAIELQQRIVNLDHQNLQQWLRLSQLYMQIKAFDKASEVLLIAMEKGFRLPQEQLVQLPQMLSFVNNPYAAAVQLSTFLQQGLLPATSDHYKTLFNYWWRAQETDKAIAALVKSTDLSPSVEAYLNLAELYYQQMQWQLMQDNVLKACAEPIDDIYVSRSNVLLGISEFKLDNMASARQAFINATLVGGEGDTANQYLLFMQAPKPTDKELSQFYGPCKPRWASSGSKALNLAGVKGFGLQQYTSDELQTMILPKFILRTGKPATYLYGEYTLAVSDLEAKLMPLIMKLAMFIVKNGGTIDGNMRFIFLEPADQEAQTLSLRLAFPVGKMPRQKGRYKVFKEDGFYSARWVFQGSPDALLNAWKRFYQAVIEQGYTPTGEARQEVLEVDQLRPDFIKMELQIALNKPTE